MTMSDTYQYLNPAPPDWQIKAVAAAIFFNRFKIASLLKDYGSRVRPDSHRFIPTVTKMMFTDERFKNDLNKLLNSSYAGWIENVIAAVVDLVTSVVDGILLKEQTEQERKAAKERAQAMIEYEYTQLESQAASTEGILQGLEAGERQYEKTVSTLGFGAKAVAGTLLLAAISYGILSWAFNK